MENMFRIEGEKAYVFISSYPHVVLERLTFLDDHMTILDAFFTIFPSEETPAKLKEESMIPFPSFEVNS